MSQTTVTLPDGSQRQFPAPVSFLAVAESIGRSLAKAAIAVKVDGVMRDITAVADKNCAIEIVTPTTPAGLEVIRHSTAHVLAMAVQKLWPGTQVTIGPVIEHGFYYDFAFPKDVKIADKDLLTIEEEMKKIVKDNLSVARIEVSRAEAIKKFEALGEVFKVEIINELPPGETISIYSMGPWFDLCRGPHVPRTGVLGAFKLTAVAGAYRRGDERNPQLTRIYGTAFANQKDLDEHLTRLEEAKRRDHRVLGKQLDLFSFHTEAPANPFFHPKGAALYTMLMEYVRRSNRQFGFQEVGTPLIMNVELWHKSGHYDNYRENMYFTQVDEREAAVKPMNCPGHCLIYGTKRHSYRDLPIRLSEFGRVHRHERSGVTHGLFRVRSFVQDDAHVFCTPEQIQDEVKNILNQINTIYRGLGFEKYRVELSTRPPKSIGTDAMWRTAEDQLKRSLEAAGLTYQLNPGDGAFYGPKIDFHLIDSIGRSWQCGTIQLDFSMPERFGLEFQGNDDKARTPVMIHRAVLGSLERFLGIFIENCAGRFPVEFAPVQAVILTVTNKQDEYAKEVLKELLGKNVRVALDNRNEKLGFKIREAQLQQVPYMLVIGDKELDTKTIAPRTREGKNLDPISPADFAKLVEG